MTEERYKIQLEIAHQHLKNLGNALSNIINQDGDDKTDGECIDEIVKVLEIYQIYKKRT